MEANEDEHLEFKEAKNDYSFDKLVEYCAAVANEGGGTIILGVTDRKPRVVVGCRAFHEPARTVNGLVDRLRLKVDCEEVQHPYGRVLLFHVPSRPLGMAVEVNGAYLMRAGETLRPMTQDQLRRILLEAGPDYSAEICKDATLADLDCR